MKDNIWCWASLTNRTLVSTRGIESKTLSILALTEPHKTIQKTTKACHKGIKKPRFLYDFGVFSAYYKLDCELAGADL